jgi:hypothetical protein
MRIACRGGALVRAIVALLILALAASAAIVAWLWWASRSAPEWWREDQALNPALVELGHDVEMSVLEKVHEARRPEDEWRVRITEEQVNAWLAANLRPWLAHRRIEWPDGVSAPQVRFGAGVVDAAAAVGEGRARRVIVLRLAPRLESALVVLRLEQVAIGRIGIGAGRIEEVAALVEERVAASAADPAAIEDVIDVLLEGRPLDPMIELADGRRVRLTGIEIDEDFVVLSCRTRPPG